MFETLSRRSRSLVDQQLGLIDQLERNEEDPAATRQPLPARSPGRAHAPQRGEPAGARRLQGAPRAGRPDTRRGPDQRRVLRGRGLHQGRHHVRSGERSRRCRSRATSSTCWPSCSTMHCSTRHPTTQVRVSAVHTGNGGLVIEVSDDGLGMTDADLRVCQRASAVGRRGQPVHGPPHGPLRGWQAGRPAWSRRAPSQYRCRRTEFWNHRGCVHPCRSTASWARRSARQCARRRRSELATACSPPNRTSPPCPTTRTLTTTTTLTRSTRATRPTIATARSMFPSPFCRSATRGPAASRTFRRHQSTSTPWQNRPTAGASRNGRRRRTGPQARRRSDARWSKSSRGGTYPPSPPNVPYRPTRRPSSPPRRRPRRRLAAVSTRQGPQINPSLRRLPEPAVRSSTRCCRSG